MRKAKSSSDWTDYELRAFNIRVVDVDATVFFNTPELPPPAVSATILNNEEMPGGPLEKNDRQFFQRMNLADGVRVSGSHVDDFAAFLLHLLNYDDPDRVICQRMEIPFPVAGKYVDAKIEVSLMNELDQELLLIIQEDKVSSFQGVEPISGLMTNYCNQWQEYSYLHPTHTPKIIAQALAAYYRNNLRCKPTEMQPKCIPAIAMNRSVPTFYRIPVTAGLLQALAAGSYPTEETVVFSFHPRLPSPRQYYHGGIWILENRRIILQYFEAFKALIVSLLFNFMSTPPISYT